MSIGNLSVHIYEFQKHSANWFMRSSKKVVISLNSAKMEEKCDVIPDYKIVSSEILPYYK